MVFQGIFFLSSCGGGNMFEKMNHFILMRCLRHDSEGGAASGLFGLKDLRSGWSDEV